MSNRFDSPVSTARILKGRGVMIVTILITNAWTLFALLEETDTNFNDLGKLLLGGVAAAVVFAFVFSFVRLKLRDKRPAKSSFTTLGAMHDDD